MRLRGLAVMDRLQQLIFSFYREDPEPQDRLEPLRSCRMRRSWGSSASSASTMRISRN